jgi:DNA-binding beta-propeller fold protein YncE
MRRLAFAFTAVLAACTVAPRGAPLARSAQVAPAGPRTDARTPARPAPPDKDYLLFVVAESADQVALVRFGPAGIRIERSHRVGMMPTEINGPHGVAVSPDGKYYYVSIAHGTPYGTLWKFATENDSLLGRVTLGYFPATVQTTPDGALAFVVNFNVHGEMVPSSVSVVATEEMLEIARTTTCTMPHGSRVNPQGTRHYSACMMDDVVVEIDANTFGVRRHFMLGAGKEMGMDGPPAAMAAHANHGGGSHDSAAMKMPEVSCSPTWAQPSSDGARLFVACNKSNDIVDIDVESWKLVRRIPAGNGVYNLGVSPDGRLLVASNKRAQSVSFFDIATGKALATAPTKRRVVHGVVISPDSRYAFITQEGVGSEPGTLEVFDLSTFSSVAALDLGQQAAGLDFFRTEAPAR